MSKFIEKLEKVARAAPQPMGFRAERTVSKLEKMVLIASLGQTDIDGVGDYVAGASAGLIRIANPTSGADTLRQVRENGPDIPWGGWLRGTGREEVERLVKAGCDFVVFPADTTSLAAFQGDEVGKILQVEKSLSNELLRTLNDLPVDAVLIAVEPEKEQFLTWSDLMICQRFASSLSKPLLAFISSSVTAKELQALKEAGVNGIIVETGKGQPGQKLSQLREMIDKLTASPHKRKRMDAILPHIGGEVGVEDEDFEDE